MQSTLRERIKSAIGIGLIALLIFSLWLPCQLFSLNQNEFESGVLELLPAFVGAGCAFLVVVFLLSVILSTRLFSFLYVIFLAALGLVFVQSTIFVWNYGPFTGEEPPWSKFSLESKLEIACWVSVVIAAVIFRSTIWCKRGMIAGALAILCIINLVPVLSGSDLRLRADTAPVNTDRIFEFSSDKNVVVLLLDAFQTSLFERVIEQYPQHAQQFKDFTFFRNAMTSFAATAGSLPAVLSGREYDNNVPYAQFLKDDFSADSLTNKLDDVGVASTVVSLPQFCPHLKGKDGICSSLRQINEGDRTARIFREALNLADLVLFRASPQLLKRRIYGEEQWVLERTFMGVPSDLPPTHANSLAFIQMLTARAHTKATDPAFKFFHIFIPHAPQRLTSDCKVAEKGRKGLARHIDQGSCALNLAARLLDTLKGLAIYDSSLVMVIADHGSGVHFDRTDRIKGGPPIDHARPLILAKMPGISKPTIEINEAPVQLVDIYYTAKDFFALSETPGIFSVARDQKRTRLYRHYRWSNPMWRRDYFPPFTVFEVTGDVWDAASWRERPNDRADSSSSAPR